MTDGWTTFFCGLLLGCCLGAGVGHTVGFVRGIRSKGETMRDAVERTRLEVGPDISLPEQSRQAPSGSFGNPDGSLKWEGD